MLSVGKTYKINNYDIIVEPGLKGGLRYSYYLNNELIYRKSIRKYHNINEELQKGIIDANAQIISLEDIINPQKDLTKTTVDTILKVLKKNRISIKDTKTKMDGDFWGYYIGHIITINGKSNHKEYDSFKCGLIDSIRTLLKNKLLC